jgi:hypothetical protein
MCNATAGLDGWDDKCMMHQRLFRSSTLVGKSLNGSCRGDGRRCIWGGKRNGVGHRQPREGAEHLEERMCMHGDVQSSKETGMRRMQLSR